MQKTQVLTSKGTKNGLKRQINLQSEQVKELSNLIEVLTAKITNL